MTLASYSPCRELFKAMLREVKACAMVVLLIGVDECKGSLQAAVKAKESVPKLDLGGSSSEAKTA